MTITALADRRMTVYRRTAIVLDTIAAAASLPASRQPTAPSLVAVTVTGSPGTGTVTVNGTVNALPDSEALVFSGPGRKETVKRFSALTPFTTSGLADEAPPAQVTASVIGADGSPVEQSLLVVASWPMRKDAGSASWPAPRYGSAELEPTRFYFDFTSVWTPRDGDVFVDDRTGEEWLVVGHPAQHGGGAYLPHHYEAAVKRREGST